MKLSEELKHFKKVLSGVVFLGEDNAMKALDIFIQEAKDLEDKIDSYEERLVAKNPDGTNKTLEDILKKK